MHAFRQPFPCLAAFATYFASGALSLSQGALPTNRLYWPVFANGSEPGAVASQSALSPPTTVNDDDAPAQQSELIAARSLSSQPHVVEAPAVQSQWPSSLMQWAPRPEGPPKILIAVGAFILTVVVALAFATCPLVAPWLLGNAARLVKTDNPKEDEEDEKDVAQLVHLSHDATRSSSDLGSDCGQIEGHSGESLRRVLLFKFVLHEAKDHLRCGWHMRMRGNILFLAQVVSAASVPILIGSIGAFSESADRQLQISAILLSITGTVAKTVEDVYEFRRRGTCRIDIGNQMMDLFTHYATACVGLSRSQRLARAESLGKSNKHFKGLLDKLDKEDISAHDSLIIHELEADAAAKVLREYAALQHKFRLLFTETSAQQLDQQDGHPSHSIVAEKEEGAADIMTKHPAAESLPLSPA